MSSPTYPETILVDSVGMIHRLIGDLRYLSPSDPDLYISIEDDQVGRPGAISVLSLYVVSKKKIYLIDIQKLGMRAFMITLCNISLKRVLESPMIKKGIFNVQAVANSLLSRFHISLAGMCEIQLMELAAREGSKEFVSTLSACIEKDCFERSEKDRFKESRGNVLLYFTLDQDSGHKYRERPLLSTLRDYCADSVAFLPGLYNLYQAKLTPGWKLHIRETTKDRIRSSQRRFSEIQILESARGPWSAADIERLEAEALKASADKNNATLSSCDAAIDEAFQTMSVGFAKHKFRIAPFLQPSVDDLCCDSMVR